MSICSLNPGEKGIISSINGDSKLIKRLFALGCMRGQKLVQKNSTFRRSNNYKF